MIPARKVLGIVSLLSTATIASAQGWQHVINQGGLPGAAIGGGSGNTIYAGLNAGHVLRSDNNGLNWTVVTNGLVDDFGRMLGPKAFAIGANGRVIRGGDNASWFNKIGSPIFYSDNAGAQWTEVPLPFGSSTRNPAGIGVSDMVVHQGAVYFTDLLSEGVWKSTNNGLSWVAVGDQLPTVPFVGFTKTYYAIASSGNALLVAEPYRGVFRSTDGGATWSQAVNGIPGVVNSQLVGGRSWAGTDVVGSADGTAYAVVDNKAYRSRDGGASWVEIGSGVLFGQNPFVPSVTTPIARKVEMIGDRVYIYSTGTNPRFFEGTAYGDSWTELPQVPGGAESLGVLGQSFAAHNGALYFSATNGIHRLDIASAVRTNLPPLVTTTPSAPFYANVGGTVRAEAWAQGTAPFTYEWRLDGTAIAGQTASNLVFNPGSTNQSGTLSVVISNVAGRVTNTLGQLTVGPVGPGRIDYAFRPQTPGAIGNATVTTFAIAGDGSVVYGGNLLSQTDAYTGVRRVFANGLPDTRFVTGSLTGAGSGPGASSGTASVAFPLDDGSVLIGATGTSDNQRYYRRLLADGTLDTAWPWPVEIAGGPRKIVRLPDGRFLIAGGSTGGIRRLNIDGTMDPTFRGPNSIGRFQANYISDFAVLPSGHIIIVGKFNDVDGVQRASIARLLPSGALDPYWVPAQPPSNSTINTMALLPDGKILIGGSFTTFGGQPHRAIARLNADGSLDASLGDIIPNTVPAGVVNAFAVQPDGRVWVGGSFYALSGRNYLIRLNVDGTVDTTFPDIGIAPSSSNQSGITSLRYTADGRLWIASTFSTFDGFQGGQLIRIFTDQNNPPLPYVAVNTRPNAGESLNFNAVVDGAVTGYEWRREGNAGALGTAATLNLANITTANSGAYYLIVNSALGRSTSAPVNVRVRGAVVLDVSPAPTVGAISNSVSFSALAFGREPITYQWRSNGVDIAGQTSRQLTLTNVQLSYSADYSVRAAGADGSSIVSDDAFLTVIPRPGSVVTNFVPRVLPPIGNFSYSINAVEFASEGRVVIGGFFTTVTNGFNTMLARLNSDGTVDPTFSFNPAGLSEMVAFKVQADGRIVYVARNTQGAGEYIIRRLNADGTPDASFAGTNLNPGYGLTLGIDGDVYAWGNTLTRLDSNGVVDAGFGTRAQSNGSVQSASVDPAGRIYLTGSFTTIGGQPRAQVARLLPDGSLDSTFAPTNSFTSSWTVSALPDGAFVQDFNGFYRFTETGTRDTNYAWTQRLVAFDQTGSGGVVGVLPGSDNPEAVILNSDGVGALPFGRISIPRAVGGTYFFIRVAPDGAYWLNAGGTVYRLNGTINPLVFLTQPIAQTVNSGTNVTFTASATGTSRVSYQWQRNGADLPGQTNATLTLTGVLPADSGDYSVLIRNRSGELSSRAVALLVLGLPEILTLSSAAELGAGDPLLLTVSARGVAPLSYQWRRDGQPLDSGMFASFTNSAVVRADAGNYDVIVSNPLGSVTSAPVAIAVVSRSGAVVLSFPDINRGFVGVKELNLLPDGRFLADGTAMDRFGQTAFTLPVTTTDLREMIVVDPVLERIYMVDGPRLAFNLSGVQITNVTRPSINLRLVRLEAAGTLLVSDNGISPDLRRLGTDGSVLATFSNTVRPVIDHKPLPDGKVLVLSYGQRIFQGNFVYDTTVSRLNSDGSIDASFIRSTNVFRLGERAERLALDRQGRFYVFGEFLSYNGETRSRIARFEANGALDSTFNPPVINGGISEIAEQVNGKIVIVGAFTEVAGQSRSLVARLNANGSHDPSFNPGTGLTKTGGQNVAFDVKILSGGEILVAGTFDHANGIPRGGLVMLNGDTPDLYFSREPANVEVALGGSFELFAEAAGTSAVSYQWYRGDMALQGETGASLRITGATADTAGEYRVVARNASGDLPSRAARVAVILPPVIAVQPASVIVSAGQTASFQVTATGLRLAYQWRRDGTNIPAATNATLVISNASPALAARYSAEVSNPSGTAVSAEALLRIRPAVGGADNISTVGFIGRHSFEGTLNEDSVRYGGNSIGTTTFVEGHTGQGVRVVTGTDYLQFGLGIISSGQYTATFWVKPESTNSINVYGFQVGNREQFVYLGGNDATGSGRTVIISTRGFRPVFSSDLRAHVTNLVGHWTHVAVVFRGGGGYGTPENYSVYINGEELALTSSGATVSGSASSIPTIGRYPGTVGSPFVMDDFHLWSRPLDLGEVLALSQPPTPAPVIARQPAGGSIATGGSFTLDVEATGSGLFYEWYRGTNLLGSVTGPALVLTGATTNDAGVYRVVVSNPGGSITSANATLEVSAAADPYAAWAAAAGLTGSLADRANDADGDGDSNFKEFVFGTNPGSAGSRVEFDVDTTTAGGTGYPSVSFRRRTGVTGLTVTVTASSDANFSDDLGVTEVSSAPDGDGYVRVTYRSNRPGNSAGSQFFNITASAP
jgi:uncharacterized delta-60 repeat protein